MIAPSLILGLACVAGCGGVVSSSPNGGSDPVTGLEGDAGADGGSTPAVDDGTGCQVVELVTSTFSDGSAVHTTRLTDPEGAATRAFIDTTPSKVFTVTCLAGAEVRLRATFGPYTGFGDYELAVGALELGGKKSDRVCKLNMSSGLDGALRGFVSCPTAPYNEDNVFARSGMPIGLGAFDAKPR